MAARDTYRYQLIRLHPEGSGKSVVYRGITDDLERREREHSEKFPDTQVKQVGRLSTRRDAETWLAEATQRPNRS